MRLLYFILCSFLSIGILTAQNSKINFEIVFNDDIIGSLTATHEVKGSQTIENLTSNTDVTILFLSIQVESEVETKKVGGVLISATAFRHANRGIEDILTTTIREKDKSYHIAKNGEHIYLTHIGIKNCVSDLYFNEPLGVTSVFSSTLGQFIPLKYISKGVYKIILPDGNTNTFTYVNGQLTQAVATISLGNVIFKRK